MATTPQPDLIAQLVPLFEQAQSRAVLVSDGDSDLGAIVSLEDYELIQRVKGERAFAALVALGEDLKRGAEDAGISLEDLEKMLDRHAS